MLVKKKHAFLSYVREDQAKVAILRAELLAAGEEVWWDQDIDAGVDWQLAIHEALEGAHSFLLCLSAASDLRRSSGTFPELRDAIVHQRKLLPGAIFIVPVRLEPSTVPRFPIDDTRWIEHLQHVDLFPTQERAGGLARLLASLRASPFHPSRESIHVVPQDNSGDALRKAPASQITRPTPVRLLLDRWTPGLHTWLTRLGILPEPPDWADLNQYLRRTQAALQNELARKTYVPPTGREVGPDPAFDSMTDPFVGPVHQVIREVVGVSKGGDAANAQIATVNRKSRVVRDLPRTLLRMREPVVLLGDPGTGKTMTLQNMIIELARDEARRVFPLIPMYVRLGEFHAAGRLSADTVMEYVFSCCAPELRQYVRDLDRAGGRLLIVFDGMDEMSRERYTEHTEALSLFAGERAGHTYTTFSCRITDFSPSFTHQRLVILPFDDSQLTEFLRQHIACFPIVVDGISYSLRGLADAITHGELAFDTRNPFVLWLLCFELSTARRWPRSRVEMIDSYVRQTYQRKSRVQLGGEQTLPPIDAAIAAWEQLAYRIATENRGTAIPIAELISGWQQTGCDLHHALYAGRVCGVIEESRDRQQYQVRFAHHRFQEYFAGSFVAHQSAVVDWLPTLNTPRWQETMINVVLLGGGKEGVQVLADSIDDRVAQLGAHWQAVDRRAKERSSLVRRARRRFGSDDSADAALLSEPEAEALETEVADRVEFAFRLLRQVQGKPSAELAAVSSALAPALTLLTDRGNPVTQVKMLTACRYAPDVDYLEALRKPLNSPIGWVRRQAIAMLGAIGGRRAAIGTDLPTEVGYELGRLSLLQHFKTYLKATRESRRSSDIICLMLGIAMQVLTLTMLAAATTMPLAFTMVREWLVSSATSGLLSQAVFVGAYMVSVGVGIVGAILLQSAWFALGAPWTFVGLLWAGSTLWQGQVGPLLYAILLLLIGSPLIVLVALLFSLIAVLGPLGAYLSATRGRRSSHHPTRAFLQDAWRNAGLSDAWQFVRVGVPALLGLIAIFAVFTLIFDWLLGDSVKRLAEWLGQRRRQIVYTTLLLGVALVGIASKVMHEFDREDLHRSAIVAAIGLAIYASLCALGWAIATGRIDATLDQLATYLNFGATFAFAAVAIGAALFMLWGATRRVFARYLRGPLPPQSMQAEEWVRLLKESGTSEQRDLLMRTTYQSLGLTAREYLDLLVRHRAAIKKGHAEDQYWQQRHDLEQVLRQ